MTIEAFVLKGRDFWQISASAHSSWSWKKLLKLRALAQNFITWSNGKASWGFSGNKYKADEVWKSIRPKKEKVGWHRVIWTKYAVPKLAIIAWMAVLNKLPTKERIKNWWLEVNDVCELCGRAGETRDHLWVQVLSASLE